VPPNGISGNVTATRTGVPVVPLVCASRTSRPGRKVTLVETSIEAGGTEVARATVLAIRDAAIRLPARIEPIPPPGDPGDAAPAEVPPGAGAWDAFHNRGVEMRFTHGAWREPGPVVVWMRLRVPVVAGEEPSPAVRTCAVADFGNGVSAELEFGSWLFINPELSVHLARPLVGEWVCLDARTVYGGLGAGIAESALSDQEGVFGRAVQSILVEPA
jgi:hypothetical protein